MKEEEILPPSDIIELITKKLGLENDNQLAKHLGVDRQQIFQFKKGKGKNLACKLFTAALVS